VTPPPSPLHYHSELQAPSSKLPIHVADHWHDSKHPHSKPHLDGLEHYQRLYKESIEDPHTFWGRLARELLTWERDFQTTHAGSFENGDNAWFVEGKLNASYNCVDRHAFKNPDKAAIIYEADDAGDGRIISYGELLRQVSKLAYTLKEMGVRKGDTVAVYLPMIPEAVIALLACARIGAVHSVVFAGFSSDSLRDRIIDAESKVVITTDEGKRGGKVISTKKIVDEALKQCPGITGCLVFKRTGAEVPWTKGRDLWWHEEVEKYPNYIAPESMSSEDPLFLLYTSGSTGKPKGVMHTTGGYLIGAAATGKYVFDIHDTDTFFCGGDVGWITGHTYVVYAPLLLGVATVVFEGTPAYPNFSRYWDIVDKYNVTQFYVAPTALRLLKRAGDQHVKHQMKSLRILGSVGEPIAAEVWKWYFDIVGKGEAHVVDVSERSLRRDECKLKYTDILANGDRLPRHHTSRWCNAYQAWICFPPLLRHRARHHRSSLWRRDPRKRCRGRACLQAAVAQYGADSLGSTQAIYGDIPECI
jgi:acetyl-CoA synthetase